MNRQPPLSRRVLYFVREHEMVRAGECLLVGVSGGPDSVCLVHVLAGLAGMLKADLHVAHLNHLLRGAEADADAEYVASLARTLGLPADIERRDASAYRREHGLSLEEAAREVRYSFFADVANQVGASTVAVGHTADDQTETILMHLIRGTGLAGLRGMPPLGHWRSVDSRTLRIARPLLEIGKEETAAYCVSKGLSPRTDSSNLVPDQLRNRVRTNLVPLLREYNPDVEQAILRTARTADADLDYIEEAVSRLWGTLAIEHPEGVAIDREAFAGLHPSLKRHLVRSGFQRVLGDLQDIESVHIESVMQALAKPAGKKLDLPRGLFYYGDYGHGWIRTQGGLPCPYPALEGEHRLNVPGLTELPGWRLRCSILDTPAADAVESGLGACLDLDVTGDNITVRARRRGERFQPLGMEQPKKLQDFMVDARIPQPWRDRVPLICSPSHILWVVGWRIDHRARVTPQTKRVLRLDFERV